MIDKQPKESRRRSKALLIGVGFDAKDEHVRITKGENFRLAGGSEETHETMTVTAIRLNEKLKRKGKTLDDVNGDEFADLIQDATP